MASGRPVSDQHMSSVYPVEIAIVLNATQLHQQVEATLGRTIGRSTMNVWRQKLGVTNPPYMLRHVQALATFGEVVRSGVKLDDAKVKTIEILKDQGL